MNVAGRTGAALGTQLFPIQAKGSAASVLGLGGTSGGNGGGQQAGGAKQAQPSDQEVLNGYVDTLYAAYRPSPLVYEAASESELLAKIEAWLRPSYERAILNRQASTLNYRAELDADAISRGMGASSYVTDVKSRQLGQEAADIAMLNSEYGATLAKTLSGQMAEERERAFETAKANQQNDYSAYMRAYDAALSLFSAYKAKRASGGSGGGSGGGTGSSSAVTATSPENCEAFLGMLTPAERINIFAGTTARDRQYKSELIASVGLSGYYRLMGKYTK
jgi:hypothetical protein